MKLKTNLLLAATMLAASMLASAQTAAPSSDNDTREDSVSAPVIKGGGAYEPTINGTAQPNENNVFRGDDKNSRNDKKQMAPNDPKKNPYWEPKDWNNIMNNSGG
jgi:hypothetical protein